MALPTFSECPTEHLHVLILTTFFCMSAHACLITLDTAPFPEPAESIIRTMALVVVAFIYPLFIVFNTWCYRKVVRPYSLVCMDTDIMQRTEIYLFMIYLETVAYPWILFCFLMPYIGKAMLLYTFRSAHPSSLILGGILSSVFATVATVLLYYLQPKTLGLSGTMKSTMVMVRIRDRSPNSFKRDSPMVEIGWRDVWKALVQKIKTIGYEPKTPSVV